MVLTEDDQPSPIHGIMVSPSAPGHNFSDPTDQIIVTGKFELQSNTAELNYSIDLFGNSTDEQTLKVTATVKANNKTHTFELSPERFQQRLFDTGSKSVLTILKTGISNISLF